MGYRPRKFHKGGIRVTSGTKRIGKRISAALLVGTILGGWSAPLLAQDSSGDPLAAQPADADPAATAAPATTEADAPATTTETPPAETAAPATAPAAAPAGQVAPTAVQTTGVIRSIAVRGAQRLEPETVRSYANLSPGMEYTTETLDTALKALYATELFSSVVIEGADTGNLVINIKENPVINRIVLEGNKRLKSDKITPEIKLAPRQIFTRSKVRADVDRIIELYKRQGRFAARVEPKIVELDQNRVDLIFEIFEGDKSKVRSINIIGNDNFDDARLRKEMYTRETGGLLGFLKSNDTYDPDRLAADQQKLRAFYLTEGYADFRVVSALAELTPDRRDFVITYVVEEGPRYKFGTVDAESALRDLPPETIEKAINIKPGDWFNAKRVEDASAALNEIAGNLGYAFADIGPSYQRDADKHIMNLTFKVGETPRVYVERIDIQGNTMTRDKVVRREFRLNEGDAFNAIKLKRSQDRIQSLGYFQDNVEIKQTEGSAPDRVVLGVDLQEKPTGQLSVSAGYSSLEKFLVQLAIAQTNFMGKGQSLDASVNYSRYSKSVQLGFTEPYFLDKQILLGAQIFRRDYNSFYFIGTDRNTTYSQTSTGGAMRLGFPITEFTSFGLRYSLVNDKITLSKSLFYTDKDLVPDPDGTGPLTGSNGPLPLACDPDKAGRYLCDEIGTRLTSSVGYTLAFDNTNGIRATRGQRLVFSQDFAGLGGDVKYVRTRADATKYWGFGGGWVFSAHAEGGYIFGLTGSPGPGRDAIRLTDRFFGAQLRGFDLRGIGPRIVRINYNADGTLDEEHARTTDALGGRAYYMGRLELEFPSNSTFRNFGLRPSAFIDVGSLFSLKEPLLTNRPPRCIPTGTTGGDPIPVPTAGCATGYLLDVGYREFYQGDSIKPRLSIGVGVNWNSPFGPLRIDIAKAILKQEGDDTKLFSFNVGTQF
jgi:outer membrane protein insertion porin family